ncbi:MAG: hypothetical protein LUG83_09690 [Lachnospiraceae bacterium]|nr:hypothetical protein [Lachnospiraceae bacterium]
MSGHEYCRPKLLTLENTQGRRLTVVLRGYIPGDEEGMIACIRDEYSATYFKRDFYNPDYLKKEAQSGHITFFVAQTRAGEIAGMMILKEFMPIESMCEIASLIFRRKYRGYGLSMPFFEFGMEVLLSRQYSAAYCLPVVYHDVTQRLLYRLGLRATGFVLNVFDMENIIHSYKNGRNVKHSQGIQICAAGRRDAGEVYLPAEHQNFCREIYKELGVKFHVAEDVSLNKNDMPYISEITFEQNRLQSSLQINICSVGTDLPKRMHALHKSFPMTGKQTSNVFLNISDKNAVWAYRRLTELGYFFTGLKPLCSEREYMVMHNSGEVEIYFEDYILSSEFKEISIYIKKGRSKTVKENNKEKNNITDAGHADNGHAADRGSKYYKPLPYEDDY